MSAERPAGESALVSVIVPCYQAENVILGAVRSILAQTHRRLEVFVVDDGSTDGTRAQLETIDDPRVTVLHQSNAGAASARNSALPRCTGKYVAFLDADDRWFPEKLAAEVAVLEAQADPVGIAYSWFYAVDDRGRLLNGSAPVDLTGHVFDDLIAMEPFLIPSVTLFHRAIFERVGVFDIDHYHEDYEFALRAGRLFPVYPTRRRLVVYRQSMQGKCRKILSDYPSAYREEMSIVDSIAPLVSVAQLKVLRSNQVRSLFYRFLMYGFGGSARTLLPELDTHDLSGKKGILARLYVRFGINVLPPIRTLIQTFNRFALQFFWERSLRRKGIRLLYE
jgi:glycosyltransferase involved in cell wall biosynthesis